MDQWWRATHFLGKSWVNFVDIQPGDEVEVRLVRDTSSNWGYSRDSYVLNVTRNLRYTMRPDPEPTGCASSVAVIAAVAATLSLTLSWVFLARR